MAKVDDEAVRMHHDGKTVTEIAKALHISEERAHDAIVESWSRRKGDE